MDDLREVRTVALAARVSEVARATIDQAISEAIEAAADSLESPGDERVFARAHSAISRVARVLAAVDVALVRSLSVRARGAALRARSRGLMAQALRIRDQTARSGQKRTGGRRSSRA